MEVIFPIRLYIRYELDPSFVFEIDFFFTISIVTLILYGKELLLLMPFQWKVRISGQAELWDNKLDKALGKRL